MTTVIDERVVEMRFNNEDFEKNVAQSMDTLDKLKKSLNLEGAATGLEEIGKAASKFSLSGITESITEATSKFSLFEIAGITAIAKVTSAAMDMGTAFLKSVSVDQISTGFAKYADMTTAIQTIISATGASIEEVEEQVEKLNWFTDETSYNLNDMISNIASFTNNGVALKDAVPAMMGIATAAGDAGKNAQAASHAMTGFSKAMGTGFMSRSNWQWIETTGVDTMRLKQAFLDAAVEAGTLTKAAEGMYLTLSGKEVTAEDFATNLKEKWLNKEVIDAGLKVYGNFASRMNDVFNEIGYEGTASHFMDILDDYKNGIIGVDEASRELEVSSEGLKEVLDELSSEDMSIGQHAFKMSQEAKTFQEAIDSVKDAVSTGWMTTFDIIFGNYEEAKKLWTGLANDLWDAFASGGAERNEILSFWKELGGRDSLIQGAVNLVNLFVKPLSTIKSAFKSMFPDVKGMGEILYDLTERFRTFTESLQPSEQMLRDIYNIFKGLFTIGKLVSNIFMSIIKAILPVARPFGSLLEMIIHFLGYIGAVIVTLERFASQTNIVQAVLTALAALFGNLVNILKTVAVVIGGGIAAGISLFVNLIGKAVSAIHNFGTRSQFITKIINGIAQAFEKVKNYILGFNSATESVTTVVKHMEKNFSGANTVIAETGTITRDTTTEFKHAITPMQRFISILKTIGGVIVAVPAVVIGAIGKIASSIGNFFKTFVSRFKEIDAGSVTFFDHIKAFFETIGSLLGDLGTKVSDFFNGLFGDKFAKIIDSLSKIIAKIKEFASSLDFGKIAIIAFAGAMVALVINLTKIVKTVSETIGSIKGVFDTINSVIKGQFAKKSTVIMDLAKAFAIIAGSLAILVLVNKDGGLDSVADAMFKLIIAFSACAAVLKGLDFLFAKFSKGIKAPAVSTSILALAGSMAILAGTMLILDKVKVDKTWLDKLKIMGLMLLELVTAATLVSKFAPKLSTGSILLLVMAKSIQMMADAMLKITSEDVSGIKENLLGFGALFGAMAVMLAAVGQVKLTSAISLLLVAKAMQIIFPELMTAISAMDGNGTFTAIVQRVQKFIDAIEAFFVNLYEKYGKIAAIAAGIGSVVGIVGAIWAISKVIVAISALGGLLKGIGIAAAGVGAGMLLIAKALESFAKVKNSMSTEDFKQITDIFMNLLSCLSLTMVIFVALDAIHNIANSVYGFSNDIKKSFVAMGIAFVGIGAAMLLITAALKIAATIDEEKLTVVGTVIGALMLVMAVVAGAAGAIKKGTTVIMSMIGIVAALAVLLAEIAIVSIIIENADPNVLIAACATILVFLGALAGVLVAASTIKSSLPVFATLALIVGSVGVIGAALLALKDIPWSSLQGPVAAIGILLMSLVLAVGLLSKVKASIASSMGTLRLLIGVIGGLVAVGAALYFLKGASFDDVIPAVASMEIVLGSLIGAVAVLTAISKKLTKQKTQLVAVLLGETIGAMVLVGIGLERLKGITWGEIIPTLASVEIVLWSMIGMVAALAAISKKLTKQKTTLVAVLMAGTILSLFEVGVALGLLSQIPWESLKGPLMAVAGVMGVMTVMMAAVGLVSTLMKDGKSIISAALLMVGTIGALAAVGYALYQLSEIDSGALVKAAAAMTTLMGVMSAFAMLMAGLTVVVGSIAAALGAGAAGYFALPALVVAIALAMLSAAYSFQIAASSVSIFAEGLGKLYEPLSQLQTLDLFGLAGGLSLLGIACVALGVGLAAFGVGGIIGAAGFALVGLALQVFNTTAQAAIPILQELASIDLGAIALGFVEMGASGLVLAVGAVGIYLFAKALEVLAAALQKLQNTKATMDNFFSDTSAAISSGAEKIKDVAKGAGEKVAGAFEKGWRTVLGWFSPPKIVVDFFADMGYALSDNGQLTSIADGSAVSIGTAFKGGFMDSMSGLGEWFQGYLGNMLGMASNFMYKIRGILNATGKEISQFGANGMPTDVIDKMYGGTATASKFTDILKEQIHEITGFNGEIDASNYLLGDFKDVLGDATEGLGSLGEGFDEAGEKSGKAGKALKDFADSLKDTLEGQINIFEKLELKSETTSEQLLANMRSNIDGFASWSHRMTVLAERFAAHGIDIGLYEYLAEQGIKGYDTMNAIYNMTEEQLEELKELWATKSTLAEGQANIVTSGYQYMGEMAVKGFSDALDDHKAAHEKAHGLGQAALDGLKEVLQINSPSKATQLLGEYAIEGFALGILSDASTWRLTYAVVRLSEQIIELFNEYLSPEMLGEIGQELITNIFSTMLEDQEDAVNPMIQAFITSLENLDEFDEAIGAFVQHFKELLNEFFIMDDEESSSQLFFKYAQMWIQGIMDALIDAATLAILFTAIQIFCKSVIEQFLQGWEIAGGDNGYGRSEVGYRIGVALMQGLEEGIRERGQEAISAAQEVMDAVIEILNSIPEIGSPSKVTRRIGRFISEGLAIGITDGAENVYNAARDVADGGLNGVEDSLGRLQDVINDSIDFNPVITPMLDLSVIREQMDELNDLMNYSRYMSYGQNEGELSGEGYGNQINYVQNNYSPKALSRVEIYRQTRNQLSSIRKVVSG